MIIGLIVEGQADKDVCRSLAERICPTNQYIVQLLGNKPNLLNFCGVTAKKLMEEENCEKVLVIWDLYPAWLDRKKRNPCRRRDRIRAGQSIRNAGLNCDNIDLICIRAELEAWLLTDAQALNSALRPQKKRGFKKTKNPENVPDPKVTLCKMCVSAKSTNYEAHKHAKTIIKNVANLKRLEACPSFVRFKEKLEEFCG